MLAAGAGAGARFKLRPMSYQTPNPSNESANANADALINFNECFMSEPFFFTTFRRSVVMDYTKHCAQMEVLC